MTTIHKLVVCVNYATNIIIFIDGMDAKCSTRGRYGGLLQIISDRTVEGKVCLGDPDIDRIIGGIKCLI
jgi:hypothetical protein